MKMPPWSYSSLTKFETCPRQYWLTKVAKKVTEPPTEATTHGTRVHEALEFRVKENRSLPEDLVKLEPIVARFDKFKDKGKVFTELEMALTSSFSPTGFFESDAWVRGIIDVGVEVGDKASLLDYKTGKVKPDSDQLKLFAAFYMQTYKHVKVVNTGFIWLKFDKYTGESYTREDLPSIWNDFLPRVQRMEIAYDKDKWIPKPSGLCRGWCPAGRENCEFWSPKQTK